MDDDVGAEKRSILKQVEKSAIGVQFRDAVGVYPRPIIGRCQASFARLVSAIREHPQVGQCIPILWSFRCCDSRWKACWPVVFSGLDQLGRWESASRVLTLTMEGIN